MTRRIAAALTRALLRNWTDEPGHFHAGAVGRAYPCHDPRCLARGPR